MKYNDLLTKLIYATKRNNITNAEIGKTINFERQTMSGRASRNTEFSEEEIENIEKHFNVKLSNVYISENTLERLFNNDILDKQSDLGNKLLKLKKKNNLSDIQMAGLLNISEQELNNIINGKALPSLKTVYYIKQNFNLSLDWFLCGDN